MRADDQYIIDGSPSYIARQWALVVESGGEPQKLTACLELALQTLTTFALAEGLIHFDWARIRQRIEAEPGLVPKLGGRKGLALGTYWQLYLCIMKLLKEVPADQRFFALHNQWFWRNSSERKLSDSAMLLSQQAIRLRNDVQGHQAVNLAPTQERAMGGDYRGRMTELMRALSRWWQQYPMFSVAAKRRLGPSQYEGALWWFLGRNRKKALNLQWTQSSLDPSASIHIVCLDDGRVRLLDLKRLLVVNTDASTNRFIEDFSVFHRFSFSTNQWVLSDGNHPPSERVIDLSALRLDPVQEEKYLGSFRPMVRPVLERFERQFREALLDDGRIDEVEREGIQHYDLDDQTKSSLIAKVTLAEARQQGGGAIDPEKYPSLAKLQYQREGISDTLPDALDEFAQMFERQRSFRGAGRANGRVGFWVRRMVAGCAAAIVLAVGWEHVVVPMQCGDGVVQPQEECDLGDDLNVVGGMCAPECTSNVAKIAAGNLVKGFGEDEWFNDDGVFPFAPATRWAGSNPSIVGGDDPEVNCVDFHTEGVIPAHCWRLAVALYSRPATLVGVGPFWIMKTEVSYRAVAAFVDRKTNDFGQLERLPIEDSAREWYEKQIRDARADLTDKHLASKNHDYPAILSFEQATAVCAFFGGALPSEDHWEFAARGPEPDPRRYPWGDQVPTNESDFGLMNGHYDRWDHSSWDSTPEDEDPVAVDTEMGCTPQGVCHLAGNAAEFVLPGTVTWSELGEDRHRAVYCRLFACPDALMADLADANLCTGDPKCKVHERKANILRDLQEKTGQGFPFDSRATLADQAKQLETWQQWWDGNKETHTTQLIAMHPGTSSPGGVEKPLQSCWGEHIKDPYGMISGTVKNCARPNGGAPPEPVTWSEDQTRKVGLIVKGGNRTDSLPFLYMPAGRLMMEKTHKEGFRCAFLGDPHESSG